MNSFIKTLFRGLLLLVPLVALIYLLNQVYKEVAKFVAFAIKNSPIETEHEVYIVVITSLLLLVLIAYLSGVITQSKQFSKFIKWLDTQLIGVSKIYRAFKINFDNDIQFLLEEKPPIFVKFGNSERPGFLIEEKENHNIVFIPKNIHTKDGQIYIVKKDAIRFAKDSAEDFKYKFDRLGNNLNIS